MCTSTEAFKQPILMYRTVLKSRCKLGALRELLFMYNITNFGKIIIIFLFIFIIFLIYFYTLTPPK